MNRNFVEESWARAELLPWAQWHLRAEQLNAKLRELTCEARTVFMFHFNGPDVSFDGKTGAHLEGAHIRANLYRHLFQNVARECDLHRQFSIAVDLDDEAIDRREVPVFTFQKTQADRLICLPDVDLVETWFVHNFFNIVGDEKLYLEKTPKVVFAGSTTGGGHITFEKLRNGSVPRIEAARYFKGSNAVDFFLPNFVQCGGADVEFEIRSEGYSDRSMSWQEQLDYRLLLSIDGNGATCSRVVQALASNSALIKMDSVKLLYYFRGLLPWVHYLPASKFSDVLTYASIERRSEGYFQPVAENGKQFFDSFINQQSIQAYTYSLLKGYYDILHG